MQLTKEYQDLRFTRNQLFLTPEETVAVAREFWGASPEASRISDRDRAFIQTALLIAVDKSEKAGFLSDVWGAAVSASPSKSLQKLLGNLAKRTAKRWFKKYIDDTPKISKAGKAAVQYSPFTAEWRLRRDTGDPSMLTNFLID